MLRGRKGSWRDDLREEDATLARRSKVYKACFRLKLKELCRNLQCKRSHFKEPLIKGRRHPLHCPHRILKIFYTLPCPVLECSTAWPCGLPEHQFTLCLRFILHHMVAFVVSLGDLTIQDHISLIWCLVPDLSCLRSHCCVLPLAPRGWPMSSITVWGSERLMSIEDCHGHMMIRAWSLACSPIQHAPTAHSMAPTSTLQQSYHIDSVRGKQHPLFSSRIFTLDLHTWNRTLQHVDCNNGFDVLLRNGPQHFAQFG